VPFPFDSNAVVYVWFDALINYLAGAGYPNDKEALSRWWPADLHLVGKDITRFHCVIWPAMLLAAGEPLPRVVFGHGFVNVRKDATNKDSDTGHPASTDSDLAERMSKSSGLMTDPQKLAQDYGADPIRYYLCSEANFGQDLTWSEDRLKTVINADLANGLGNLASRVISMIVKYQEGRVGHPTKGSAYLAKSRAVVEGYRQSMKALDLRGGLQAAMGIVVEGNVYVDRTQPFTLAKDKNRAAELEGVLAELANGILIACCLLFPFMPRKMEELYRTLTGEDLRPLEVINLAATIELPADRILTKGVGLFPRVE
jgi:methionyl-tRNA synthetase